MKEQWSLMRFFVVVVIYMYMYRDVKRKVSKKVFLKESWLIIMAFFMTLTDPSVSLTRIPSENSYLCTCYLFFLNRVTAKNTVELSCFLISVCVRHPHFPTLVFNDLSVLHWLLLFPKTEACPLVSMYWTLALPHLSNVSDAHSSSTQCVLDTHSWTSVY